jgi:hypothetical protein
VAAGGAVLARATIPPAAATAAPASPADPVFGLIAAHKQIVGTVNLIEAKNNWLHENNMPISDDDEITEPASAEMGLFLELLEVVPTTLAGVVALVTYLDQVHKKDPWKFQDNYATPLIGALATAFARLPLDAVAY